MAQLHERFTRVCPKVPGQYLYKDVCLTWKLNSSITFNVLPFCTNTAVPTFPPCLEASLEVPYWNCVKYPLRFLLNLFNGVECSTLHPNFSLGKRKKSQGVRSGEYGGCGIVLGLLDTPSYDDDHYYLFLSTALQLLVHSSAFPTTSFRLLLSWTKVFQFGTFNLCISFSTSSSQRIFGLPIGLFEMGFQACNALTILVSCILSI